MLFLVRAAAPVLLLAGISLPSSALAAIQAGHADDVCGPAADPCIVAEEVFLQSDSVLDFGPRTLRIVQGGVLDFGDGGAIVRSGKLEVHVDDGTVVVRGSNTGPAEVSQQQFQRLEAVRQCSVKTRACFRESDCDLGPCDARRCELEPARGCSNDSHCDLGTCTELGSCSVPPFSRCDSNADCMKGPCSAALTCRGQRPDAMNPAAEPPLECTSNADCELGDCTVGDGSIDLGGDVNLQVASPHLFLIRAASDIALRGQTQIVSQGGWVEVVSEAGNVDVEGGVAGSGEHGAYFQVFSGGEVAVDAPIAMNGNLSAADVAIHADGNVVIRSSMSAQTLVEGGIQGRVWVSSRKDLRVEASTEAETVVIRAGFAGPHTPGTTDDVGGTVVLDAVQNLTIADDVHLHADGDLAYVGLSSGQDLDFRGTIQASSHGQVSYGARAALGAGGNLFVRSGASVVVENEENAPLARLQLNGYRNTEIDGELRFVGPVTSHSIDQPGVWVEGCLVRIGANAEVLNSAADSSSEIVVHGSLTVEDGASWSCADCLNHVRVRTEGIPVDVTGSIEPPLDVEIDPSLESCPNCTADCSLLDEGCYVGTCDEDTATCIAVLVDGSACDDGDECTVSDHCTDDVCKGLRDVACGDCGSATLEWGEECDDGDPAFAFGDLCSAACQWTRCGQPTGTKGAAPTAADALYVLRASVNLAVCPLVLCDVSSSGFLEASDALLVLRSAVGLLELTCPAPES